MSGQAGMLYQRPSFTVPASNTKETDVCDNRGFHVPSGPARRRVCQHCGIRITSDTPLAPIEATDT